MQEKKEIVFVIPGLAAGGAEKSLVNLLNTIDYSRYNVDLIVFNKSGIFLTMLPSEVNLIEINGNYEFFSKSLNISIFHFVKRFQLGLAVNRLQFFLKNKFIKNKAIAEQQSWENQSESIPVSSKKYDAAIGFLEKSSLYYVIEKLQTKNKIAWIHTNYSNSGMNAKFDDYYFQKFNAVVGVSEECVEDLQKNFPHLKNKFKVIYNIVSTQVIQSLAKEKVNDRVLLNSANVILTIARLSHEKGCDLALDAAKIMTEKGIDFKWLIIGDGQERNILEVEIKSKKLEDKFLLIGLRENPYPHLNACSIYVQPSRYEGKSMAIEEAKILQKPIVITNYPTAKDQINPNKTGIIAEMNPQAIAQEIMNLIANKELQTELSLNLAKEQLGTENEINKLYQLIHD